MFVVFVSYLDGLSEDFRSLGSVDEVFVPIDSVFICGVLVAASNNSFGLIKGIFVVFIEASQLADL